MWLMKRSKRGGVTATPAPAPVATAAPAAQTTLHRASRLVYKTDDSSKVGVTIESKHGGQPQITRVAPGSLAEQAGLCKGDVILTIGGTEVDGPTLGCALLATAPAGFVEIEVNTTAVPPTVAVEHKAPLPVRYDDEIEILPAPAVRSVVPSYDREVGELRDMGLAVNEHEARHALQACNGDLQLAVERLLKAT